MLRILRQLTAAELRQAAVHAGARPGAAPEEIIRSLSRLCGANMWGLFPATTDDMLLDCVGRRLGMPPLVGGPRGVPERERAIFCCYLRQAWQAADPERRWTILHAAVAAWDGHSPAAPSLPHPDDDAGCLGTLETMLQTPAGCRALAMATEAAAMPLPGPEPMFGPLPFPFTQSGSGGHQALYGVLRVLWRARVRLLRERRTQLAQLQRHAGQLEALLRVRRENRSEGGSHWALNPLSGLSVTAAAGTSVALHALLAASAPVVLLPAAVVGAAGLAWSVSAVTLRQKAFAGSRTAEMLQQQQSLQSQAALTEQEIARLQSE